MRGKIHLMLLFILLLSCFNAMGFDFSPSEVQVLKLYDAKPQFELPAPVIYENVIFAPGGRGDSLIAITMNGKKIWSQKVGGFILTPPILVPDVQVSPTLRESWIVVVTESQELRAYETRTGGLRIYGILLPYPPARIPLQYAGDGKTLVIPLQSSIQLFDLRARKEIWFKNLTFRVSYVKLLNDGILVSGESYIVYLDLEGNERWVKKFDSRIEALGSDSNHLAILLENKTLLSLDVRSGAFKAKLDMASNLGYAFPSGEFPVVSGIAILAGSNGVIHQVDLRTMELRRPINTWIDPVKQPLLVENMLLYFGRGGLIKAYHLPAGIILSDLRVEAKLNSDVIAYRDPVNRSFVLAFFDDLGSVRIVRFPEVSIKLLDVREEGGGYLIEGYVCSAAKKGQREPVSIYTLGADGKGIGEKGIGSISPGECGARFSTFLPSRGAIGLIVGGFRLPPNVLIGISVQEWMTPSPVTTTKPAVIPSLSYEAPSSLIIGDEFSIELKGVNGWNATNLTFILTGEGIEERVKSLKAKYGESFDLRIESRVKQMTQSIRLLLLGDGLVLREEEIPIRVERGELIDSVEVPREVRENESLDVSLTLVNRYSEGEMFRLVVRLGNLSDERTTERLAAGESLKVDFSLKPKVSGDLKLVISVLLTNGTKLEERELPIRISEAEVVPPATKTVTQTNTQVGSEAKLLPLPLEYLLAGSLVLIVSLLAFALTRPKRKPELAPKTVLPEVVEGAPEEVVEEAEEIPEEVPLEELPFEWEEEFVEVPKAPEEVPPVPPAHVVEAMESELSELRRKLSEVKDDLKSLEDLLGFEPSPYRLVDAESALANAELRIKEGKVEEAERLLRSARESLNVLWEELREAKRVFTENWGAVENRIDIMLRVWGKAPATMLTMVPPSFRIASLERYRRMHPERKLELRGDELVSTAG